MCMLVFQIALFSVIWLIRVFIRVIWNKNIYLLPSYLWPQRKYEYYEIRQEMNVW